MPSNDLSQPGPSQKTDSQDTNKKDEEGKQENRDHKEANNSNDNKTNKDVKKKKMTYRVVEVKDPAMIAQIECVKVLSSLGADLSPNATTLLALDETKKIVVVEAEDSSSNESDNGSTNDTDQERIMSLIFGKSEKDEDQVKKPEDYNKD